MECLSHRLSLAQAQIAVLDAGVPGCGFMDGVIQKVGAADANAPPGLPVYDSMNFKLFIHL